MYIRSTLRLNLFFVTCGLISWLTSVNPNISWIKTCTGHITFRALVVYYRFMTHKVSLFNPTARDWHRIWACVSYVWAVFIANGIFWHHLAQKGVISWWFSGLPKFGWKSFLGPLEPVSPSVLRCCGAAEGGLASSNLAGHGPSLDLRQRGEKHLGAQRPRGRDVGFLDSFDEQLACHKLLYDFDIFWSEARLRPLQGC